MTILPPKVKAAHVSPQSVNKLLTPLIKPPCESNPTEDMFEISVLEIFKAKLEPTATLSTQRPTVPFLNTAWLIEEFAERSSQIPPLLTV